MKLIPQDKANHGLYGALVAAVVACAALLAFGAPPLAAGGLGVLGAAVVGWAKEQLDARANAKAIERGEEPPHAVEAHDIKATALGGLLVAVPLVVVDLAGVAWRAMGALG